MSAPALKKRKKTPKPTPTPPHQPPPTSVLSAATPPLSAIAARKAAAAALLLSTSSSRPVKKDDYDGDDQDQEAFDILNSPVPSSPSGSTSSSSGFSSSSLLRPEPLTLMMDGELVSLGSSRPTASTKQQRKRKGKGKAVARYWDEDLPEMETQGRERVEFIGGPGGGGGQRGWSPSGGRVGGGFDREMGESEEEEEEEVGLDEEVGSEVEEDGQEGEEEEEEEGALTPGRAGKRKRDKLALASAPPAGGALSSFLPSFGKNVIRVEEDWLRKMFMDVEEGEGAVVVSLKEGENLIFSGLCRLYPLVSSLSILNATLHPPSSSSSSFSSSTQPSTPHPVYAPICYPLPVITPSAYSYPSSSNSSPLLEALGLHSEDGEEQFVARFLLRELRTGLEGMGQAVPGFDRIWKGDEAGWGVRGFHPILTQSSHLPHTLPPSWLSSLENSLPRLPRSLRPAPQADDSDDSDEDEEEEEDAFASFTALIKGPKRSGKSTFARALVNGLLDRYRYVAVLEADLGQGEWGVEGSVSLVIVEQGILGPPFTHPSIPVRSHHIGSPSPRSNPTAYLSAISNLLEHYRLNVQYPSSSSPSPSNPNDDRNVSMIPLVINTQGWVKGLGMDLLKKIEEMVGERVEFEFEVVGGEDGSWEGRIPVEGGWGRLRGKEYSKALARAQGQPDDDYDDEEVGEHEGFRSSSHHINSSNGNGLKISRYILLPIPPSSHSSRFTPSDLRTLSLLSYFHARFPPPLLLPSFTAPSNLIQPSPLATSWDFTLPLVSKRPLTLDWNLGLDGIFLVGPGAEEVEEEEVLRALDVSVVGLVALDEDYEQQPRFLKAVGESSNLLPPPYTRSRPPPSPSTSSLLGFAIVRAVPTSLSSNSTKLELLTPLPNSMLPNVRVLVKGETELPVAGMVDWRRNENEEEEGWEDVPYLEEKRNGGGMGVVGGERRKVRRNVGRRG